MRSSSSSSSKDKLKVYTSRDWVSDFKTGHVDVDYNDKKIFDSDSSMVSADDDEEMKVDAGENNAVAEKPKMEQNKTPSPKGFMAEYNAMFGGAAAGGGGANAVPPPPLAVAAIPPRTKLTSQTSSGVLTFPSLSSGQSMSFMKSDDLKTGTLDAALIGTSLDLTVSSSTTGLVGATASADSKVPAATSSKDAKAPTPDAAITEIEQTLMEEEAAVADAEQKVSSSKPEEANKQKSRPSQEYIDGDYTEFDVLAGRGGRSNNWAGNKRYLKEVIKLQPWYEVSSKTEKTDLAQSLVNYVQSYGGRFLKFDPETDRWFVVSNLVARRKASQGLREYKPKEERKVNDAGEAEAKKGESTKKDDDVMEED